MSDFVLDASVVLTWCFPDENSAFAREIASMFKHGDSAVAPSFWPHEVLNALLVGTKRKRISISLVNSFLADLAGLPVELKPISTETVFDRIQSLARERSLTAYDAAYLEIAQSSGVPLATLDKDLIHACRAAGVELL